jgi:hypothetical protein
MSRALVRREVEGGYLCAIALREPGFSRTMYLACHRQREDSPLVRAVREVAASLGRAPVDSRVSTWHVTAHSSTDTPRRTPMAKKKTGSSTRSKRRATIGPRDLETRKAGSVQGGFLGGLINKAGKSIRPATKA